MIESKRMSKIGYLDDLFDTLEVWCSAFRKEKFLLRARTTQRVENTNKLLKARISALE